MTDPARPIQVGERVKLRGQDYPVMRVIAVQGFVTVQGFDPELYVQWATDDWEHRWIKGGIAQYSGWLSASAVERVEEPC